MILALALSLAIVPSARAAGFDMSKPPAVPAMRPVKLPPRAEWKLKNGLTVVLVEDRRLPMITAILATRGGEAALPAEDAGLADATAELLTDGTRTKSSRQVAEAAEMFGGDVSAGSSPDAMYVEASALSDKADAMFSLLSEVVREPSFPEAEVALRKANMQQELDESRAESDFLSTVVFDKKIFAGHPYAFGTPTDASIARLNRDRVAAAYRRLLTPRGAILVLVGDLTEARAKSLVAARLDAWSGGEPAADAPPVSAPKAERAIYLLDRPKSTQASFILGNLAAREDNPAYFDLLVVNGVLGGSFSSRLVRDIRENKGYTYDISSGLDHRLTGSVFDIRTPVRTEVAGPALKEIFSQLKDIREKGPTAAELAQAEAYIAGSFARRLETQHGVAKAVLHQKLMRLPDDFYDRYVERVLAVTPASAERAARTFMRPDEMTVVAVGDAAALRGVLSKFSEKPVVAVSVDGD
jgi:zinc protease